MSPSTSKIIFNSVTIAIAVAGGILAVGDEIKAIPNLPGWLINAWPVFIFIATITSRIGSIVVIHLTKQQGGFIDHDKE